MTEKNLRWLVRYVDSFVTYWFTVWLFWINKPVWKWVFLAIVFVDGFGSYQANKKLRFEEYN